MRTRPRILVTGFGSFPGVPANPTETLIERLAAAPEKLAALGDVTTALLQVEYGSLPARLAELGAAVEPDVAIHFGVSRSARGFTIEQVARNRVCTVKPDNAGFTPSLAFVREGSGDLATSLPTDAMLAGLTREGLPAERSDDAGDYLCNYLFFLSRGGQASHFTPALSGFVHVPPFDTTTLDGETFTEEKLERGALVIIDACAAHWQARG